MKFNFVTEILNTAVEKLWTAEEMNKAQIPRKHKH
jgi:hypothetical protein